MRKILGRLGSDERHTFQAEFGKYGYKRYYDKSRGDLYSPTMVVRNVRIVDDPENPKMVTDHLWLNLTKGFANLLRRAILSNLMGACHNTIKVLSIKTRLTTN